MARQKQTKAMAGAVALSLLLITAMQAAERRGVRAVDSAGDGSEARWPNVAVDAGAQWPNVAVPEPHYPGQALPVREHDTTASLAARRAALLEGSGAQWPNVSDGAPAAKPAKPVQSADADPQWPNVSEAAPAAAPAKPIRRAHADRRRPNVSEAAPAAKRPKPVQAAEADPQWPNASNAEPQFPTFAARSALAEADIQASASLPQTAVYATERKPAAPFSFEAGLRYWYSSGLVKYAFANQLPFFGDPTSTLDWHDTRAQSGEVFARIDHKPSGLFAKGVAGLGRITGGTMTDRDYFITQFIFSDTDSRVKGDTLNYATFDVGYAFQPMPGMQIGGFVGYQYWRERMVALGLVCNQPSIVCTPGVISDPYDTRVIAFEPEWHAARIGVDAQMTFAQRWKLSGEIAVIPWAKLRNEDSHLLRTDLGPSPNVISTSRSGFGMTAEMFVNYELTPNIEIGAGLRYWQMVTRNGTVEFGPSFANTYPLREFDMQRYGALVQVKGKF